MPLASSDFQYLADVVRRQSAIVLETGKEYLVESRLLPVARELGLASVAELATKMRSEPGSRLADRVTEAMTTNETSFFRDVSPFEALRQSVIPDLLARRASTRRLRIWCAAASSGQEPYTIAMILDSFPELRSWDVRILATDLSVEMVNRCREGRYSSLEANRGLPASLLVKYFDKQGVNYQARSALRSMIDVRAMNLASSWPPLGEFDIVFLRNVLIYFDVATKRDIFGRVRRVLRPDGYLFLGAAETTVTDDGFERMPLERTGCYRLRSAQTRVSGVGSRSLEATV